MLSSIYADRFLYICTECWIQRVNSVGFVCFCRDGGGTETEVEIVTENMNAVGIDYHGDRGRDREKVTCDAFCSQSSKCGLHFNCKVVVVGTLHLQYGYL